METVTFCNMGEFRVLLDNLSRSADGADLTAQEVAARIQSALHEEFGLEYAADVEAEFDEDWLHHNHEGAPTDDASLRAAAEVIYRAVGDALIHGEFSEKQALDTAASIRALLAAP